MPIKNHKTPPVHFSYLGNIQILEDAFALFTPEDKIIVNGALFGDILNIVTINCYLDKQGYLQLSFAFDPLIFRVDILESWGKKWVERMESIIRHCCSSTTYGCIMASDFTLLSDPVLASELETVHFPALHVKPRDVEDIYPATPLQASFITALARDPQSYMVRSMYDVEGPFDVKRLEWAWNRVAALNTILRTVYVSTQRGVFQVVLKNPPGVLVQKLEWAEDKFEEQQEDFLAADYQRGFSIDSKIFARITVAQRKGTMKFRLFWTIHHSIIDGWSVSLLLDDLLKAYSGEQVEARPPFKEHVESILSINASEAREYWRSVFDGADVSEKWSILHGSAELGETGSISKAYNLEISFEHLQYYCRSIGITASNFLRAIWAIVLRHYTRCDDLIFGCVITGRDGDIHAATRVIGPLINTIPIRVVLRDSMTIVDLIHAVQEHYAASLPYSQVSLSDIRRWTDIAWTQEMFQTLFSYQYFNSKCDDFGGNRCDFKISEVDNALAKMNQYLAVEYPLILMVNSQGATVSADALINTAKMDSLVVDRMMSKFREVVALILGSSTGGTPTICDLDGLSNEEESLILELSSGEQTPLIHECLHHGFEANAINSPHSIAVMDNFGRAYTYEEVDLYANSLAHELRRHGVIPGCNVGLVIKRSIEMVIGIIAILKAGGAYVPIDAAFPRDRIEYILNDAGCSIVVTTKDAVNAIPDTESYLIITIEAFMYSLPDNITKPTDLSTSDDTAYIVYTSGTTGKPKGVPIRHGGAMNCIQDFLTKNGSGPGVFQSQFMSVGFDGAIAEIFTCLTHGGALVLSSDENRIESLKSVESLLITPTGLQHFKPDDVPRLRVIALGAEPVPQSLVDKWLPHVKLFNAYGLTEASIMSSIQELTRGDRIGIGRPINNMSYYVLDHKFRMVPLGVTGELYIAGPGVARSYLNRPELTAEKFLENPFMLGTTMYRTGDLVRWNADGNLEILGRTDDQVKLKGYRVELGEVSAAMYTYPGVDLAVAIVKESTLVGFVTPASVDVDTLRDSLFDILPDYVVPAIIVALDEFPVTTNGKIDKQKLKDIPLQPTRDCRHPVTDKHKLVVSLMASVFNIDESTIDLNTSFFALGGDSISAIALVSAFRRYSLSISVSQIFKSPTPSRLAAIAQEVHTRQVKTVTAVVGGVPLTPIQRRYFETKRDNKNHFNQGWVLRPREHIDYANFKQAITQIVGHHDMIRTRFTKDDNDSWMQAVLDVSACDINIHHIECKSEDEIQEYVKQMASSLNIAKGSMHCAALFEFGSEQRIYFTIHHLVVDLVPWRILLEDLESLLQGGRLEEKTTSFQEWAISQVQQASRFCPTKWTQNIQHIDMSDLSESNTESIPSDNQVLVSKLSASMSSLLDAANEPYRTNNQDLILAALLMSFHETTGKSNISLNLDCHGREPWDNQLDVSRTVGWFTSVYPVTLSMTPSYSIGKIIMTVKNSLRTVPDKGLSYGAIKYLAPLTESTEMIKRHKLAPISLNYLGHFYNFEKADAFLIPDERIDASHLDKKVDGLLGIGHG
ncbi:uncharacterized protein VTP21DRAFT_4719 [Calcarisporiella thermophila]|uniref:uncharacterized protein n=1 Tax=Calcarisporiella thermophila TaxID=911321 RepID=UPI0037438628